MNNQQQQMPQQMVVQQQQQHHQQGYQPQPQYNHGQHPQQPYQQPQQQGYQQYPQQQQQQQQQVPMVYQGPATTTSHIQVQHQQQHYPQGQPHYQPQQHQAPQTQPQQQQQQQQQPVRPRFLIQQPRPIRLHDPQVRPAMVVRHSTQQQQQQQQRFQGHPAHPNVQQQQPQQTPQAPQSPQQPQNRTLVLNVVPNGQAPQQQRPDQVYPQQHQHHTNKVYVLKRTSDGQDNFEPVPLRVVNLQQQQHQWPQQQPQQQQHVGPVNSPLHRPASTVQSPQFTYQGPASVQPQAAPPPPQDIMYNVEHLFEENGKQVKKVPIKLDNGETMWVDSLDSLGKVDENSFSMPLDNNHLPPAASTSAAMMGQGEVNRAPPEVTSAAIERVVTDKVNPAVVAADLNGQHNFSQRVTAADVRAWVKQAGKSLPNRYKVKQQQHQQQQQQQANQPRPQLQGLPPQQQQPHHPIVHKVLNQVHLAGPPEVAGGASASQQQQQQPPLPTEPLPVAASSPQQQQQQQQPQPYVPKYIPGMLALCKNCGCQSSDFNVCESCKKKIPAEAKKIKDPQFKGNSNAGGKTTTIQVSVSSSAGVREQLNQQGQSLRDIRTPKQRRRKLEVPSEPECVNLSSSDEEDDEPGSKPGTKTADGRSKGGEGKSSNKSSGEEEPAADPTTDEPTTDDMILKAAGDEVKSYPIQCRSIRIGSYKSMPPKSEHSIFTKHGMHIRVPDPAASPASSSKGNNNNPGPIVGVNVRKEEIRHLMVHFGRSMPIIFVELYPKACAKVRDALKMARREDGFWLDVEADELEKRITILPDKIPEETRSLLKSTYQSMEEIDQKRANEILVKISPSANCGKAVLVNGAKKAKLMISAQGGKAGSKSNVSDEETKYTSNLGFLDYACLEYDQFLNDAIIDFYLQHIKDNLMPEDMKSKTYFMETFFYQTLIRMPSKGKNKLHAVEDDPNLSKAQKRYARVARWTRKVDIFEKDFIVIPINDQSHWFLAVICYPGLIGCKTVDGDKDVAEPARQKKAVDAAAGLKSLGGGGGPRSKKGILKKKMIGNTSIIPINGAKLNLLDSLDENRDEIEAEEDEMIDQDDLRFYAKKMGKKQSDADKDKMELDDDEATPVKQPCILIFDSLRGGRRARVAAQLREYLQCEWNARKPGQERSFTHQNFKGNCPRVPQQPNFSDCGIYLLQFIESFFTSPIGDFTLPLIQLQNWFSNETVKNKRQDIAKLIRDFAKEQNPGKSFNFPDIPFFGPGYSDSENEDMDEDEEEEDEEEGYDDSEYDPEADEGEDIPDPLEVKQQEQKEQQQQQQQPAASAKEEKLIRPSLTKNDGHALIVKKDGKVTISHFNGKVDQIKSNSKVTDKAKSVIKVTQVGGNKKMTEEKKDEDKATSGKEETNGNKNNDTAAA